VAQKAYVDRSGRKSSAKATALIPHLSAGSQDVRIRSGLLITTDHDRFDFLGGRTPGQFHRVGWVRRAAKRVVWTRSTMGEMYPSVDWSGAGPCVDRGGACNS
jgi:hypothetical protein